MGKASKERQGKGRQGKGRKEENKTGKMEKVDWEGGLSSKMDNLLFYSTLVPSLRICYTFNVAFVLSLCIRCAKSLCKKS